MIEAALLTAAACIPAGRYAVGVSGGADSVALLHLLLHERKDLHLHVVHLDHQTRGEASTGDARFVQELARKWGLPHTIATRDQIQPLLRQVPINRSALYRAVRHELYRRAAEEQQLDGVLLAHHADDQAETIVHHLIRGSGPSGMPRESQIGSLWILRPLLDVAGTLLREYLTAAGQSWREDASNASPHYFRNRVRKVLRAHPDLRPRALELGDAFEAWRGWVRRSAPDLPERFRAVALQQLPPPLAADAARRWLLARGARPADVTTEAVGRLITMANDAASPPRQHFPGRLLVRRRKGELFVE